MQCLSGSVHTPNHYVKVSVLVLFKLHLLNGTNIKSWGNPFKIVLQVFCSIQTIKVAFIVLWRVTHRQQRLFGVVMHHPSYSDSCMHEKAHYPLSYSDS